MAVDTLIAYVGVYDSVGDAEADYDVVKALHTEAGLIDAYDAAVVERRDDGKTKIVRKHETPTRVAVMNRAAKLEQRQIRADNEAIERDAAAARDAG